MGNYCLKCWYSIGWKQVGWDNTIVKVIVSSCCCCCCCYCKLSSSLLLFFFFVTVVAFLQMVKCALLFLSYSLLLFLLLLLLLLLLSLLFLQLAVDVTLSVCLYNVALHCTVIIICFFSTNWFLTSVSFTDKQPVLPAKIKVFRYSPQAAGSEYNS